MSIITDALKKAEHERELKAKPTPEPEMSTATVTEVEPEVSTAIPQPLEAMEAVLEESISQTGQFHSSSKPTWKNPVFIGASAIFLMCLLALIFVPRKTVLKMSQPVSVSASGKSLALPYVLSGISQMGDRHYAIVNDIILQAGDSIDGAHVREILEGEVTLDTRAGEIKLKLT